MSQSIYYINTAGFTLKFAFHKSQYQLYRKKFIKNILFNLQRFITNKTPAIYTIDFVDLKTPDILLSKNNSIYIKSCKKVDTQRAEIYYHIQLGEFNLLFRDIIEDLLSRNYGFLFHASASYINGKAVIFLGSSGAGKSTIITLLQKKFKPLGDDSIVITNTNRNRIYTFYSTPFMDKHFIEKRARNYQLGQLFFLEKSTKCGVEKIKNYSTVMSFLLKHLIVKKSHLSRQAKRLLKFVKTYKQFYLLSFTKDEKEVTNFINHYEQLPYPIKSTEHDESGGQHIPSQQRPASKLSSPGKLGLKS